MLLRENKCGLIKLKGKKKKAMEIKLNVTTHQENELGLKRWWLVSTWVKNVFIVRLKVNDSQKILPFTRHLFHVI